MGDLSRSIYVRARKRGWTSVAAGDDAELDPGALAVAERADVAQVWFDDDAGVTLQLAGADGFAGELSVSIAGHGGAGAEDERFIDALAGRKLLTAAAARTLKARLMDPPAKRGDWIRSHGVERLFQFPPVPATPVRRPADDDTVSRWRRMTGR
jgi:hypothetical protein